MDSSLSAPLAQGRVAEIFPWEDDKIVKLARDWVPADWVDYEFRIAKIVHASGLNVPEPFARQEVQGRPGIIYARVDGPTMLDRIGYAPHKASRCARILGELHAEMHTKPGVPDLPALHTALERNIMTLEGLPDPIREAALERLSALPAGEQLCHGDFHPGNVVLSPTGPVIIDWPDATRGHPLADVARTCLLIQVGGLPAQAILRMLIRLLRSSFLRTYLRTYFRLSPFQRRDLQPWLLPVTVARLREDIESEWEQVQEMIRGMLP